MHDSGKWMITKRIAEFKKRAMNYLRGEFLIWVLFDMKNRMNQNGILRFDLVDDQKRKLI